MVGGGEDWTFFATLKTIPAIPLPRLGRVHSLPPFAYSRYDLLFLICSKVATDFLENFLVKNLYFQRQFS